MANRRSSGKSRNIITSSKSGLYLTQKDIEVLQLRANGLSIPQIGDYLGVAHGTISSRIDDMHADNEKQSYGLLAEALRQGLIK